MRDDERDDCTQRAGESDEDECRPPMIEDLEGADQVADAWPAPRSNHPRGYRARPSTSPAASPTPAGAHPRLSPAGTRSRRTTPATGRDLAARRDRRRPGTSRRHWPAPSTAGRRSPSRRALGPRARRSTAPCATPRCRPPGPPATRSSPRSAPTANAGSGTAPTSPNAAIVVDLALPRGSDSSP